MEKLLPCALEAEQGVIGSIIIDPEAITYVYDFLKADDFYRDAHRTIYETICRLYQSHEPADYITICDELERAGKLAECGGAHYITGLINCVPTSGNVEYYGHMVERTALRRRLIHAAGQIAAEGYEEPDADVALNTSEALLYRIRQGKQVSSVSSIGDILYRYYNKLDELHERKQKGIVTGVPTGFSALDGMTGGLQKSDLVTLAARPGVGKTSISLNIARNALLKGYRILFFSLEMAEEQLARRLLAMETHIDQTRLRAADIDDEHLIVFGGKRFENEWALLTDARDRISDAPGALWIDDTPAHSPLDMRSIARRYQAEHGLDAVIVDYLQRAKPAGKHEGRVQEVSSIARDLKSMARDLNVPVLALAQLSRSAENVVPQMSHLRESGDIENESDIVAFLHVDNEQQESKKLNKPYDVTVIVEKHRNGPLGAFQLRYEPTLTQFYGIAGGVTL